MKKKSKTEIIDIGNTVVCDMCNEDYTNSNKSGGILFGSEGVCPDCAPRIIKNAKEYNEEKFIKGRCPDDMSFRDWILELRGGDNAIKITSF